MATIQFKGKPAVWNHHLSVPYHTLEKDEKKSLKGTNADENLIVQGDNLLALKALLPKYQGKVKCIYIDPPYNTGNEGWKYNDNVNSPTTRDWMGQTVGKEGEDLTRHDKWLCMMTPRLKLLRELLSDDGVIFVSIDDNEVHHLRCLMDEVFMSGNFVELFSWVKTETPSNLARKTKKTVEYVLCYQKTDKVSDFNGLRKVASSSNPLLNQSNKLSELVFPADVVQTNLKDQKINAGTYGTSSYTIELLADTEIKQGKFVRPVKMKAKFRWSQAYLLSEIERGTRIIIPTLRMVPNYERDDYGAEVPSNLINSNVGVDTNEQSSVALKELFGDAVFEYPKPVNLVSYLLGFISKGDDIILDSFGGSGTTAHAVLDLNKEDGGNRKFILVEMEDYANKTTAERVRLATKKYGYGAGFTYYTLGPAIDAETLLEGKKLPTFKEFAKYVYYLATGKNHPDESKISEKTGLVGKDDGASVYLLYEQDVNALKKLAITLDWAQKTHDKDAGRKIVYAPACYLDDEALDQYNIRFVGIPYNLFERSI